jgi:hypothetical protein
MDKNIKYISDKKLKEIAQLILTANLKAFEELAK